MNYTIRQAKPEDTPAMYLVSLRAHQSSYGHLIPDSEKARFDKKYALSAESEKQYIDKMTPRIKSDAWLVWVAEVNDRIAGYTLEERISSVLIQKKGLFVDPDYYSMGIGTALFEKSLEPAPKGCIVRLSVVENNEKAKNLYKKYDFKKTGYEDNTFYGARLEVMERVIN